MEGSYVEAGVKRKDTLVTIALRISMIMVSVLLFLLAFIIQWVMILAAALICLDIFLIPYLKVEYEYIFCDGQIDFDCIRGGARRKHILRIDMEEVEIVAMKNSHALDSYQNISGKGRVFDFTSGTENGRVYTVVVHHNGNLIKVSFEPSEKMLSCIQQKSPRKFSPS